jgi:hypothetical protein
VASWRARKWSPHVGAAVPALLFGAGGRAEQSNGKGGPVGMVV